MNEINIRLRQEQLRDLQKYVKDIDKNITLILQSLQWDRKHLLQSKQMATCKFDSNHRILANNVKEHEEKCYLISQNYVPGEMCFPEPLEANAVTVVKLSAENINDIINYAAKTDPCFKRSSKSDGLGRAPLTLGRLQATHSVDERRAIYEAVAAAAPAPPPPPAPCNPTDCDHATDASATAGAHAELLALRDARRRRARHRGAARDGYQHQLRGLISAQMESFTGKWNDGDADPKTDVTIDESDDGRRRGRESDRRDRVRNSGGTNNIHRANRRECKESGGDERREYERENRKDKKREYDEAGRENKRRKYEYDKNYKERNKKYEYDDRRRQDVKYDKEYFEIKQEKDDYTSDRRKRKEQRYDYKDREQKTDRSSSKDTKRYHKRDERHHKQKSVERRRERSRDREYNRNYKNDIDCSYLKIKKEPPDY